ncbi:MAG: BlaI/MecI/CopY family transcriptional regulator [Chitinophagales bacterium]|nr:BlaI/MecI/CopY family transcriptional regulator [Bacteroidota bacterium]MCB9042235.1 BlaI/MecI/CopY family transcriptional regulator [Chitinophagales bacterium]
MSKKLLTGLELKVMNVLWKKKKAFVKDILDQWSDKETLPAYNTVSTTVRILEEKGYIDHEAHGRTHCYFPTMSKLQYQKIHIQHVLENVFSGSHTSLISALMGNTDQNLSDTEWEEIKAMIDKS